MGGLDGKNNNYLAVGHGLQTKRKEIFPYQLDPTQ